MSGRKFSFISILSTLLSLSILLMGFASSQDGNFFLKEYQDPAGDVLFYNTTNNGTAIEKSGLDIKWVKSSEDGKGNVIVSIDLKSKDRFIIDNNTKYVVRVFTTPDNSTGFNITYRNLSAELVHFNETSELKKYDIISNVSIIENRDNEIMEIEVNITKFLSNISFFNIDAYSMMEMSNATYLDYISQLPGHPEYIDPEVEEAEDLDTEGDSKSDSGSNLLWIIFIIFLLLGMIIIGCIIIVFIYFQRKKRSNDNS